MGGGRDCVNDDNSKNETQWNRVDVHLEWLEELIQIHDGPSSGEDRMGCLQIVDLLKNIFKR